jgi:hypothetical protein
VSYPDRPLDEVNAEMTAQLLICDALKGDPARIEQQIAFITSQDNAGQVVHYLARYAAAFLHRLHQYKQLPSEPLEYMYDAAEAVASSVPVPD